MRPSFMKNRKRAFIRISFIFLIPIYIFGCGLGGKPAYPIKQYIFEYSSPLIEGIGQTNELIKVERFSVAQEFNTLSMVYREGAFQRGVDPYHRWRVNPGDMVTDYLMRDLRRAGLFRAVFSYQDNEDTRFLIEGRVDEFLEIGGKEGRKASLAVNVTLLDLTKKETIEKVIFQRDYRYLEPLEIEIPEGLARGMSKGMEKFSKDLIKDLFKAIQDVKR